jgi:hypothetical protein
LSAPSNGDDSHDGAHGLGRTYLKDVHRGSSLPWTATRSYHESPSPSPCKKDGVVPAWRLAWAVAIGRTQSHADVIQSAPSPREGSCRCIGRPVDQAQSGGAWLRPLCVGASGHGLDWPPPCACRAATIHIRLRAVRSALLVPRPAQMATSARVATVGWLVPTWALVVLRPAGEPRANLPQPAVPAGSQAAHADRAARHRAQQARAREAPPAVGGEWKMVAT